MENVNRTRAFSSPELAPLPQSQAEWPEDYCFEGIATNVKLLLKLIQDHNQASSKCNDDRKAQRIAGMMTILDDVKSRIQKSQSGRKRVAELRRCNTDIRPSCVPVAPAGEKKPQEPTDENQKLRKQLSASMVARKSLEVMCSSLGKEKEIMAVELAKKVHELNEMEELVNDLKAQNETLLAKLKASANEQKEKKSSAAGEVQGSAALQERNRKLSEQLLKSLDGYRSLKRKYKGAKEQNRVIQTAVEKIEADTAAGLERIRSFRRKMPAHDNQPLDIDDEISALEQMFESFDAMISTHKEKNVECANHKAEINASKSPVLA